MMEPIQMNASPTSALPLKPWALTGAKGRPPQCIRSLFLEEGALEKHNNELQTCYHQIAAAETKVEQTETDDCEWLLAAWGTCARISKAVVRKARERGIKVGLVRPITLWPFPHEPLARLARQVKAVLVVEMNSGQMLEDVRLAVNGVAPVHFSGYPGGRIPTETDVWNALTTLVTQKTDRP